MSLPKNNAPIYTITLPLSGQVIKIRPFLVKEDKLFITAITSENPSEITDTILQVLESCTFGKVNISSLSLIDIEYMLIKLKSYSKGETFDINVRCKAMTKEGKRCGHVTDYTKNVDQIDLGIDSMLDSKIMLTENLGIKLKPPSANLIKSLSDSQDKFELTDTSIIDCIEMIWEGDNVWYPKDQTPEELREFVDNITSPQMEQMKAYFASLPSLKVNFEHVCEACGNKESLSIKGIYDFLG